MESRFFDRLKQNMTRTRIESPHFAPHLAPHYALDSTVRVWYLSTRW